MSKQYLFKIGVGLCIAFTMLIHNAYSQSKIIRTDDDYGNKILSFQFHYTYEIPAGDLANRFGNFHNVGTGLIFKFKNHWVLQWDLGYQFGTNIKENHILDQLTNSSGVISNTGGYPATYSVSQRGMSTFIKAGRIFPLGAFNRNSGIMVTVGGGYFAHMLNFSTTTNDIAPLTPELRKGYDRLTAGPALTQFVGYYFHSLNRYYNFYIGFDAVQAFTTNQRGYNYDQMQYDNKHRLDMAYGIRIGWMIPIYLTTKDQEEFEFK